MHPAGHINPCVSLSAFITQNISFALMIAYWCAHLLGAVVGSSIQYAFYNSGGGENSFYPMGVTQAQAFGYETLATFLFVLLVQSCALRFSGFLNPHVDVDACDTGTTGPVTIGLTLTGSHSPLDPSRAAATLPGPSPRHRLRTCHSCGYCRAPHRRADRHAVRVRGGPRLLRDAQAGGGHAEPGAPAGPADLLTRSGDRQHGCRASVSLSWSSVTTPPRTTPASPHEGVGQILGVGIKSLIHRTHISITSSVSSSDFRKSL